jgi:hypothetical protein
VLLFNFAFGSSIYQILEAQDSWTGLVKIWISSADSFSMLKYSFTRRTPDACTQSSSDYKIYLISFILPDIGAVDCGIKLNVLRKLVVTFLKKYFKSQIHKIPSHLNFLSERANTGRTKKYIINAAKSNRIICCVLNRQLKTGSNCKRASRTDRPDYCESKKCSFVFIFQRVDTII